MRRACILGCLKPKCWKPFRDLFGWVVGNRVERRISGVQPRICKSVDSSKGGEVCGNLGAAGTSERVIYFAAVDQ